MSLAATSGGSAATWSARSRYVWLSIGRREARVVARVRCPRHPTRTVRWRAERGTKLECRRRKGGNSTAHVSANLLVTGSRADRPR
eukprot:4134744-Pleurochrysis_carterae.AAC.1